MWIEYLWVFFMNYFNRQYVLGTCKIGYEFAFTKL